MKTLYETTVKVSGGREGKAHSTDGKLDLTLAPPKELGGTGQGSATNPEQLFAVGYGACFESAVRHVARSRKISVTQSSVLSTVKLFATPDGGFQLGVDITVTLPEVAHDVAQSLVDEAHNKVCPYSKATRGNIDVHVSVADNK